MKLDSVKSFNSYSVDKPIEFWSSCDRSWVKGKISDIRTVGDKYFVYVEIKYWSHRKHHSVKIYREDWLK